MFPGEKVYWQENSSSSCCLSDVDGGRLCGEDRADRETSGHRIYGDREAGHSGRIRGNDWRAKGRRISTFLCRSGRTVTCSGVWNKTDKRLQYKSESIVRDRKCSLYTDGAFRAVQGRENHGKTDISVCCCENGMD